MYIWWNYLVNYFWFVKNSCKQIKYTNIYKAGLFKNILYQNTSLFIVIDRTFQLMKVEHIHNINGNNLYQTHLSKSPSQNCFVQNNNVKVYFKFRALSFFWILSLQLVMLTAWYNISVTLVYIILLKYIQKIAKDIDQRLFHIHLIF